MDPDLGSSLNFDLVLSFLCSDVKQFVELANEYRDSEKLINLAGEDQSLVNTLPTTLKGNIHAAPDEWRC